MTSNQESYPQSNSNPFPGLRAFKDSESHLFFGREQNISDVLAKLDKSHFVAVVGTSGTGKSSLIKAGVLPAIVAEG
jgi:ABC-type transport system involved in cytochrome bd biosynthesis fused ATPase/permease subunit